MAENLMNYDPEDSIESPSPLVVAINTSPNLAIINPSLTKSSTPSIQKPPKKTLTRSIRRNTETISPRIQSNPTPNTPSIPPRMVTPPLAMAELFSAHSIPSVSLDRIPSSEISFTERNLVIMAIQEQVDWNAVAIASGVGIDKVMKWWLRATSELVRRG